MNIIEEIQRIKKQIFFLQRNTGGGGSTSWGAITGTLSSQTDLNTALGNKQATLVSGANIKTINGASVLGAGDLTVSVSISTFEQDLGSSPKWSGKFTVSDANISHTSKIQIWQRFASLTGKGTRADENEMDSLIVNAEAGTGQMIVYWQTQPQYTMSPAIPQGNGIDTRTTTQDSNKSLWTMKRLGKVKGNFKFNYLIS